MNPIEYETKDLDYYFYSLKDMYPTAYNKAKTDPYTKTRVILMNGTEYESVWFMHQFARHCNEPEILCSLARIRNQEQWQQKRIACLKPINESILETTIGYEQLAIDLTACLAKYEKDENNKKALDFALLEDFDHLYRFSNLLMMDKNIDAKELVGGFTEIMPGRPTIAEHRYPADNLKKHMNADKAELYSKLVGCTITAAEQQTMNYYMNISQWYKNDLGRKLYAEIAMVEEEHVTQYESLKDPTLTWLEQWVMHEYAESYLYYSAYESEVNECIKQIWLEHFEMECAHLKEAIRLLEKYEKKKYCKVIGDGEYPVLLKLGSNKEYVRDVIASTITLTAKDMDYKDIHKLKDDDCYFSYQNAFIGEDVECVPSHAVINQAIKELGKDYRYQDEDHPIEELSDRKKDNTTIARTN
ncbi:MAG: hypothetical protein IJW32_00920 [Clostridia bacterium]|nr:hypothetical protein [Clostridia bacterium]